ncbi:TPA: hypothetical protein DCG86_08770 [Candidatus Marinimicrobia bacterium]|nr:hypothetical protein [Candidatus Neomarinimicrobiota bacterium]HBY17884.1 hypothetical protein [Candidatus Neomarinimicrobiota bacterium]
MKSRQPMRNTLICTVGTSLFYGNLKPLSENTIHKPENWKKIKAHFDHQEWGAVAKELLQVDPSQRLCGAEINTIEEVRKKEFIHLENIFFLVSDTEDGRNTGKVLKHYFENRQDLKLKQVDFEVVEDLDDQDPRKFKTAGLKNLVRKIGEYLSRISTQHIAIDATGGYKAQIAVALLIGQALDIPVFYKHERFSEIIDFPPLPVMMDYDILGRNAALLHDMECGKTFTRSELGEMEDKLTLFFTDVEVDGETMYELNAIGQIYLMSFRQRFNYIPELKPLDTDQRKSPTFGNDHHFPSDFKSFVQKVWEENRWIQTCWTVPYAGQKGIQGIGFHVQKDNSDHDILVGSYKIKNFGARFQIHLSDERKESLNWAADTLNQKYRQKK